MSSTKLILVIGCVAAGWLALAIMFRVTDPPANPRDMSRQAPNPKSAAVGTAVHAQPRPRLELGPRPKAIDFEGEFYFGKSCIHYQDTWALARTENLKVHHVVGASNPIRVRLKDACIFVPLFGQQLSSKEKLEDRRSYSIHLTPSEATWAELEQGERDLVVAGEELKVVGSVPDELPVDVFN